MYSMSKQTPRSVSPQEANRLKLYAALGDSKNHFTILENECLFAPLCDYTCSELSQLARAIPLNLGRKQDDKEALLYILEYFVTAPRQKLQESTDTMNNRIQKKNLPGSRMIFPMLQKPLHDYMTKCPLGSCRWHVKGGGSHHTVWKER